MKTVGIVRNIDHLGRFVVPKELRDRFYISNGTSLDFFTDGEVICTIRAELSCVFCDVSHDPVEFRGRKKMCTGCWRALSKPSQ